MSPTKWLEDDGLPTRDSQDYALEKLHYVGHIQQMYAVGTKNSFANRGFVDLMAGPGRGVIGDTGRLFEGSPVRSMRAPFSHRLFVEKDPELAAALRRRVPPETVIDGDCNDPGIIEIIRQRIPRNALTLAFVDNLGLTVPLATLASLKANRKVDLLVVVQIQDLTRNVSALLSGNHDRARIDAFFGNREWEVIARDSHARNDRPGETAAALVTHYGERLRALGYPEVAESVNVMKNSTNAPRYRLVMAAGDKLAVHFLREAERIAYDGQRRLGF